MNIIYEKNGYIFIHNEDSNIDLPSWITSDYPNRDPYFLLNTITRQKFKEFFLPLLKTGTFKIATNLYNYIKSFEQNISTPLVIKPITTIRDIELKTHQISALNNMLTHNKYALFYGTGTGKTLIAISYIYSHINHYIINDDIKVLIKRIVIVTPKKVVPQYEEECRKYLGEFYNINTTGDCTNHYTITILNFESLHKLKVPWCDCLIIDESHKAKSYTSNINKQLRELSEKTTAIYLFTGTPVDKSRHEIFPQLAILDSTVYPSKTLFNYRYFHLDDYHNPKSEKKHLSEELTTMIQAYSDAVKTTEVVTLPELHNIIVNCDHPEDYHDEIGKKSFCYINNPDDTVNAKYLCICDTPTMRRIKQQEICSGFLLNIEQSIKDSEGNELKHNVVDMILYTKTLKQNKLQNLLEANKFDRGIIFTCFKNEIPLIQATLYRVFHKKNWSIIDGSTSKSETLRAKKQLEAKEIDFIIANVNCTNAGLDMYFINKVLFYSLPDSYITYHQCVSRIYRMGQTQPCYVYHLICKDSVETAKYKALKHKKSFTNKFYDSYKEAKS